MPEFMDSVDGFEVTPMPHAAADPRQSVIVNVIVEDVEAIGNSHSVTMIQQDFAVLHGPVCALRLWVEALIHADRSAGIHIGELFHG